MSTDTKDILQRLDQGVNKADVVELCEEVDHLRQEALNEVAVRAELISKLRSADHELQNCRKELAQLREQHSLQRDEIVFLKETESKQLDEIRTEALNLGARAADMEFKLREADKELTTLREQVRPRSIKDEPPKLGDTILALYGNTWCSLKATEGLFDGHTENPTFWMPQPAAPPQPDAFEEWAKKRFEGLTNGHYWAAREGWDAAIQSTKGKL